MGVFDKRNSTLLSLFDWSSHVRISAHFLYTVDQEIFAAEKFSSATTNSTIIKQVKYSIQQIIRYISHTHDTSRITATKIKSTVGAEMKRKILSFATPASDTHTHPLLAHPHIIHGTCFLALTLLICPLQA